MARRKSNMGKFKCTKCDRVFSMKAHLARHMNTLHASPQERAAAKAKRAAGRPPGRPPGSLGRRSVGRPSALVTRLGLRSMTLEELREVIDAAKIEAQHRLVELQQSFI